MSISIKTIVDKNIENKGTLDVLSLCDIKKSHDKAYNFTVENLIKRNKEKREKLLEMYIKQYTICLEKIDFQNRKNMTDLFYDVPLFIPDCIEYNYLECLDFIEIKLKSNFFDIYRVNKNTLFISWKFIEINKNKKKI